MCIGRWFTALLVLSLCSILSVQQAAGQEPDAPSRQTLLEQVEAPQGFDVTIFATPPEISYPTAITASADGELFVAVDKNSSLDQQLGRGEIIRAVDRDGDGRADEFTAFVDSVDSPRGLIYDGETLYVMHPPTLTAYADTDGDGEADRSRTLLEGLGFDLDFRGADHTTNGIKMGIDGWIYIAVGDYGFTDAEGTDGTRLTHRGGGIVRVRPDGSELELVASGLRNVYDIAVDPYLNGFVRGNTNDGGGWDVRLNHIVLGADYGYPTLFKHFSDEVLPPLADYGGGSGTGAYFVHDPGFPAPYNDVLYTADWGRSKIYRHPMQRKGASFAAQQETFLDIPRPTDMTVDGHSRMYVSSWHEGMFRYEGENVGYIARLTYPGQEPASYADVRELEAEELVDMLSSPSRVHRLHAQREILRRGTSSAFEERLRQLASGSEPTYARVAAIFTLKQLLGADAHDFLLELTGDETVREFALRALVDRKGQLENVPTEPFVEALDANDPRVQVQAVTGLARLDAREAADEIVPLTTASDPVLSHLAVQSLATLNAVQTALNTLDASSPQLVEGALKVLKQLHDREAVQGLIDQLEATQDPGARRSLLEAIARLYYEEGDWSQDDWWGTRPDTRGPYYNPVTWAESSTIKPVLRRALLETNGDQLAALLDVYVRNRILPGGAAPLITEAADASKVLKLRLAEALVGQKRLSADLVPLLEKAAGRSDELRVAVVRFLTSQQDVAAESIPLLQNAALNPDLDPALRRQAFASLGNAPDEDGRSAALSTAVRLTRSLDQLPEEVRGAWQQFVQEREHAENADRFVEMAQEGRPAQRQLAYAVLLNLAGTDGVDESVRQKAETALEAAWEDDATTVDLLRAIGHTRSSDYADRVDEYLDTDASPDVQEAASYAAEVLEEATPETTTAQSSPSEMVGNLPYEDVIAAVEKAEGSPEVGRKFYVQQGCPTCHTVSQDQPLKGPFLGGIAERYSRRELAESIMRPNAQIAQGFATHWFEMEDGTRHVGFIVRESGDEVEIRNPVGSETVLDKSNIADRGQQENSMMPQGLVSPLTPQQLASLISYLASLSD